MIGSFISQILCKKASLTIVIGNCVIFHNIYIFLNLILYLNYIIMECFSMMRISMSLPKKLLADFDEVLKERGYQSRSKGIRDALQDYIVRHQWMNEMEGERIGIITIIYDHHYTGVMENLADIQHSFRNEINMNMHLHMTEKYCMEIVVVNGDISEIRELTDKLMRLKGVEHVKLTTTANGEEFSDRDHEHDHHH